MAVLLVLCRRINIKFRSKEPTTATRDYCKISALMASSYSPARFSSLSDEIFADDIETKSTNNNDIIPKFTHAHSSLLDSDSDTNVEISSRSFQGDDHSIIVSFQHTKAR